LKAFLVPSKHNLPEILEHFGKVLDSLQPPIATVYFYEKILVHMEKAVDTLVLSSNVESARVIFVGYYKVERKPGVVFIKGLYKSMTYSWLMRASMPFPYPENI